MFSELSNQQIKERQEAISTEILNHFGFSVKAFYSPRSLRLTQIAYDFLSNNQKIEFKEVEIDILKFKMQDLVKISKLNSDLFYIDNKNSTVHTLDIDFANWCNLNNGNILAIRVN